MDTLNFERDIERAPNDSLQVRHFLSGHHEEETEGFFCCEFGSNIFFDFLLEIKIE